MGTHGRRGLEKFFLGSVAERVVRAAPCPVVTVRGKWTQDLLVDEPSLRRCDLWERVRDGYSNGEDAPIRGAVFNPDSSAVGFNGDAAEGKAKSFPRAAPSPRDGAIRTYLSKDAVAQGWWDALPYLRCRQAAAAMSRAWPSRTATARCA
jgi:hypothetical protein